MDFGLIGVAVPAICVRRHCSNSSAKVVGLREEAE
jgi:hypothetical protein